MCSWSTQETIYSAVTLGDLYFPMFLLPFAYRKEDGFWNKKRDVITESHHALCYLLQIAKATALACTWRKRRENFWIVCD